MGAFKVVFSRPGAIEMKSRITPVGWVRKLLKILNAQTFKIAAFGSSYRRR
jgi:hypothetical protein